MIVTRKIDSEQITSGINDTREFVPREIKKSPLSALTWSVLSGLILEKIYQEVFDGTNETNRFWRHF